MCSEHTQLHTQILWLHYNKKEFPRANPQSQHSSSVCGVTMGRPLGCIYGKTSTHFSDGIRAINTTIKHICYNFNKID
jgi:hypothetical protein